MHFFAFHFSLFTSFFVTLPPDMGILYIVPTPVGNMEDMTFRAVRILKEVDLVLAEDTRTSGILLKHFDIRNQLMSHHKFNALVSSGLPCDRFAFEGFLPQKKGRQSKIESLKGEQRTMIFYESPYRVVKTLEQFAEAFGASRQVSVCREISKIHEESVRGTLEEVIAHFKEKEPKGEIVIVLEGEKEVKSER